MAWHPTPAGMRRKRVTLLRRNTGQDTLGQATGYTAYLSNVAALIETLQGQALFKGQAGYTAEVSHRVNIRFPRSVQVLSKDRVSYGGKTYDVKFLSNPNERNIELDIYCLELADGTPAGA